MKKGKIELFRGKNLMWRFRVVAGNGEIVAQSEEYTSKRMAERGTSALIKTVLQSVADGVK